MIWHGLSRRSRSCVDEVARTLLTENGQCSGYTEENSFYVHVNHGFPIIDREFIEWTDWHRTSIAEQNIKPTKLLLNFC